MKLANPPADCKDAMTYADLTEAGVPLLTYGNFITVEINFVILVSVIFMTVRQVNKLKNAGLAAPAPATPEDVVLLRQIRDSLAKR